MIGYEKWKMMKEIELMPELERAALVEYVAETYLDREDLKSMLMEKAQEAGLNLVEEEDLGSVNIDGYVKQYPMMAVAMIGKKKVVDYLMGLIHEG